MLICSVPQIIHFRWLSHYGHVRVLTIRSWHCSPVTVQVRSRRRDLLLCLVDICAALAQVEVHLGAGVDPLHPQQCSVLPLVPQTTLVARKDGLTPQSKKT